MRTHATLTLFVAIGLGMLVACGAVGPSGSPSTSPSPTATPRPSGSPGPSPSVIPSPRPTTGTITVTSHAQAAALVLASDPRFVGIGPQLFDVIGQCCWYEVAEDADGWLVTVTIGSGDCMAGCIDRQTWRYHVDRAGAIELVSEEGAADAPAWTGSGPAHAQILVVAGPTCPVETDPPDPSCAARPVAGAEIVVRAVDGTELARGVTDAEGRLPITAEAGTYWIDPQPVEGYMGTASAIAIRLAPGAEHSLSLFYDTGIR
jgi:hypothetical protein